MSFKLIINNELAYDKHIPKSKAKLKLYDYYEYISNSCREYLRRTWLPSEGLDVAFIDEWYQCFNIYQNEARRNPNPQRFEKIFEIDGGIYKIQMVDDKLNLTY